MIALTLVMIVCVYCCVPLLLPVSIVVVETKEDRGPI